MTFVSDFKPEPLANTNLFKPIKLGGLNLSHRVVMSPMARFRASSPGNVPVKEWDIKYYSARSTHPGSLVFTGTTLIAPEATGFDHAPGIWSDEQVEQWTQIIKTIHGNKSYIFVQLGALGRLGSPKCLKKNGYPYVSASPGLYPTPELEKEAKESGNLLRALTIGEIHQYVEFYKNAAKNAIRAGADGVELHCLVGYLMNQFLDPKSNHRTDKYGGSIENRARFPLEVLDALIEVIGAERLGIRISPYNVFGGMSGAEDPTLIAQYSYLIGEVERRALEGNRIAYVHVLEPRVTNIYLPEGEGNYTEGTNDFIYSIWKGPVIRSGNYALHPEDAKNVVKDNRTLISYARFFTSNPDLPERLEKGLPLTKYDRDLFLAYTEEGYNDYQTYEQLAKSNI
ncbi:similar to Saccharomyces cerevisiae YHR179W OYE2 Conserved NADPH oxidoreductase containing flavin mononucleotide (FMN) [Maudiozyma saulgeensis]|uniref:Similar to Saccharomyces cerevisiae YHR179W OYE2 Conserved NADPH oxidoreductase containing flavin mononucleotide (FMN) n=1 Tax=Maudiozyma saulgeensis TaxID=1789683 RepID=A0A1X7R4Q0_9SACH|nr:similar to Saccharomyces cerevisiae YHR179W OYE2 Conserved NADPH oxidoreductase containing flavin mononucleotide (FMN) [Kazachstania saulgeensis]